MTSPSTTRPQSDQGQVPSPRETVPADCSPADPTISNSHTRPFDPGPSPTSDLSRTPNPLGANRQFGDSGTKPSQYGQVTVRAQRYPSIRTPSGSGENSCVYFGSARRTKSRASLANSSSTAPPSRLGHSAVALRSRVATGFKSLAIAAKPIRSASKGMLPLPRLDRVSRGHREENPSRAQPIAGLACLART